MHSRRISVCKTVNDFTQWCDTQCAKTQSRDYRCTIPFSVHHEISVPIWSQKLSRETLFLSNVTVENICIWIFNENRRVCLSSTFQLFPRFMIHDYMYKCLTFSSSFIFLKTSRAVRLHFSSVIATLSFDCISLSFFQVRSI